MAIDFAARARALIGTRFRPQGRDQAGLDCIGLVAAVYDVRVSGIPRAYRLRGDHRTELEQGLAPFFRRLSPAKMRSGDIMLLKVREDQVHLAVRSPAGFIHAHAGIGRVVETPGQPEWPLLGAYRRRTKERSG
jgi:hypothetical protein